MEKKSSQDCRGEICSCSNVKLCSCPNGCECKIVLMDDYSDSYNTEHCSGRDDDGSEGGGDSSE